MWPVLFPFLPSLLPLEGFHTQASKESCSEPQTSPRHKFGEVVWTLLTKPTLAANHFPAGTNPFSMLTHNSWLMDTFPQKGCVGLCRKILILSMGRRRLYRNISEFCAQPASLPSFHVSKACRDQAGKQSDGGVWCVKGKLPKAFPFCSFTYLL